MSAFHCIHPQAVIFDLDGTLLDTAPDIIAACNATLEHFGYQAICYELALTQVTSGMRALLKLGVPDPALHEADIEGPMRDYFAQYYLDHINVLTKPFDGMIELLCDLEHAGIKVAVVTNKYENMAQKLLAQYDFYPQLSLILGCDSLEHSKPHPEPILKALEHLGVAPYDAQRSPCGVMARTNAAQRPIGMRTTYSRPLPTYVPSVSKGRDLTSGANLCP